MIQLKQFVPESVCLSCDGCCRYAERESNWSPLFLFEEIVELTEKNIVPSCLFTHGHTRLKGPAKIDLIEQNGQFFCPCFDIKGKKCKIYSCRPLDCQLYPFVLTRKDNKVYLAVDEKCHYMRQIKETKPMKDYIQYLIKFFASKKMERLLKDNPEFIQEYPLDLKFLTTIL